MTEKNQAEVERLKYETFYADPDELEEEEELCAYGYAEEECYGEGMAGIEYCEFLCPFAKLNERVEKR